MKKILFVISIILLCGSAFVLGMSFDKNIQNNKLRNSSNSPSTVRPIQNNITTQNELYNEFKQKYLHAIGQVNAAARIKREDMRKLLDDTTNQKTLDVDLEGTAARSDLLISYLKEANTHYQLAKEILETIKQPNLTDAAFELIQSINIYVELADEEIQFYQYLYEVYIEKKQKPYPVGNGGGMRVNIAYNLMHSSFARIDDLIKQGKLKGGVGIYQKIKKELTVSDAGS